MQDENNKAVIEKALKRTFSPEFLNRIDDIVIFNSLTKDHIFEIIDILMKGVMKRLNNLGIHTGANTRCKRIYCRQRIRCTIWCKAIARAIQKYLEDPLAEEILNMNVKQGDILIADLDKERSLLKFDFKKTAEEASV